MKRSESNGVRTIFKKYAVQKKAIREANKILGKSGKRICRYTGQLLDLNDKNFHKLTCDEHGYQSVSKLGSKLYREGALEVKDSDKTYEQHDRSGKKTAS